MPPTPIGRGLRELGITWIAAHSSQAKGRVERNFKTAQDRLVKVLLVAGVKTIEQANQYLEEDYQVWWERELTVEPANPDDAHRPLDKSHNLAASLSHVETRQVRNDYTLRIDGELYQIEPQRVVQWVAWGGRARGAAARWCAGCAVRRKVFAGDAVRPSGEEEDTRGAGKAHGQASPAPAGQRLEPELRLKESAESLASGAGIRLPAGTGVK